jgi:DNA-binding MarR family transcriptional regulator
MSAIIMKQNNKRSNKSYVSSAACRFANAANAGVLRNWLSMSTAAGQHLDEIAQDLFGVMTQLALCTQAHQKRGAELREFEFLALSVLQTRDRMIVGDIQRILGVLPAQMSRIIRSLEHRQTPLIECQINPQDKRKVDVRLTQAGVRSLQEFREARVQKLVELLRGATDEEQEDLSRLIAKLQDMIRTSQFGAPAYVS